MWLVELHGSNWEEVNGCDQPHVDSLPSHPPRHLQRPKETEHMKLEHNCKEEKSD